MAWWSGSTFDWSKSEWYRIDKHGGNFGVLVGALLLAVLAIVLGVLGALGKLGGDGTPSLPTDSIPTNYAAVGSALKFHVPLNVEGVVGRTNTRSTSEVLPSVGVASYDAAVGGVKLESGEFLGFEASYLPSSIRVPMNSNTFTVSMWVYSEFGLNADANELQILRIGDPANGIGRTFAIERTDYTDLNNRSSASEANMRLRYTRAYVSGTTEEGEMYRFASAGGNVWHHFFVTADGDQVHVYQNGVYLGGSPIVMPLSLFSATGQQLKIGASGLHVSDFRVYNRSFTPKEAALFYAKGRNFLPDYVPVDATPATMTFVSAVEALMNVPLASFTANIRSASGTLLPMSIVTGSDPTTQGYVYNSGDGSYTVPARGLLANPAPSIKTDLLTNQSSAVQAAMTAMKTNIVGGATMIVSAWIKASDWNTPGNSFSPLNIMRSSGTQLHEFRIGQTAWGSTNGVIRLDSVEFGITSYAYGISSQQLPAANASITTLGASGTFHHVVWVHYPRGVMGYIDGMLVANGGKSSIGYLTDQQFGNLVDFFEFGCDANSTNETTSYQMSHLKMFVTDAVPHPDAIAALTAAGRV